MESLPKRAHVAIVKQTTYSIEKLLPLIMNFSCEFQI